MRAKCLIEVIFPDSKAVDAAIVAISHEGEIGNRSKTKITKKDSKLVLEIDADDIVALRASANAFMRALTVFEGIEKRD